MNIFRQFTLRSLKENKIRTIVTIIGIILSVAMFTATIEAFVTVESYLISYAEMYNGKYHVGFSDIEKDDFDSISEDERVKDYTYIQQIGYAEIGSQNEYKPYLYIAGIPSDFTSIMPVHLIQGRLPENSSELVVSEHLYLNGNVSLSVGQQITLEVGHRQLTQPEEGSLLILSQEIPLRGSEGEVLTDTQTKTYTIVGICLRPDESIERYEAPGYTAYTINEADNDGTYTIFTVLDKPYKNQEFYVSIKEELGIMWGNINYDLLMFSFQSFNSAFPVLVIGLMTILIGLIVFGSVALIYNSFSISVSERTKQFGILKSIGATKKQIRKSVLYEAAVLCIIGIPIGLIAGCFGIAITFYFLNDTISTLLADLTDLKMRLVLSPLAIIISGLIGFVTVIISAYIPASKAIKINPIDSVRQTREIKIKRKSVRVSPLTGRIFGFEATLSSKNFKRNKRKYRATVFSLFVSVVLFVSASSLSAYFTDVVEIESGDMNYDVAVEMYDFSYLDVTGAAEVTDELIGKLSDGIRAVEGIEEAAFIQNMSTEYDIDNAFISKEYRDMLSREQVYTSENQYLNTVFTYNIIDDEAFRRLLKENGLDEGDYFDKNNPKTLVYDKSTYIYQNDNKERVYTVPFLDSNAFPATLEITKVLPYFEEDGEYYHYFGQTEEIDDKLYYVYDIARDEGEEPDDTTKRRLSENEAVSRVKIAVGEILSERPYFVGNGTHLIYPESVKDGISFSEGAWDINCYIITSEHKKVTEDIKQLKNDIAGSANNISIIDYAAEIESTRALVTIARVLAYGFIILISMIAAANVFNTISTNISLRRRELATLRSVGLTRKGLAKMMIFESLLYGIKSLAFSLPVSLGVTCIIWFTVFDSGYYMSFYVPWDVLLIAILSVFVIVAISMLYSVKKVSRENTVEALRNENI